MIHSKPKTHRQVAIAYHATLVKQVALYLNYSFVFILQQIAIYKKYAENPVTSVRG
jgi:hypothetical protein